MCVRMNICVCMYAGIALYQISQNVCMHIHVYTCISCTRPLFVCCVCVCDIHTNIHTYIPTHAVGHHSSLHTYTYTHTYIHACMHAYIHANSCSWTPFKSTHTYIHTYIRTHTYIQLIHTYQLIQLDTIQVYTHTHTYIHTYIHAYQFMQLDTIQVCEIRISVKFDNFSIS